MGIRGKPLRWIETLLENRLFIVKVKESISEPSIVNIGVGQGSNFKRIKSNIFVNDE